MILPDNTAPCSLGVALDYHNPQVIHRFTSRYAMAFDDAAEIFEETKKWLWLASHSGRPRLSVTPHVVAIDEMWHNFICFTVEYARYCERFGRFLHHFPTTRADKDAARARHDTDPDAEMSRGRQNAAMQIEFIANHLGNDAVHKWYVEFPRRFVGLIRLHATPLLLEVADVAR
jgi:hypothetical protein